MYNPVAVEEMLGIKPGTRATRLTVANAIEHGLNVRAVSTVAEAVSPGDNRVRFALVPKATLERRAKSADKRLTVEEGNRLFRAAEVYSFAESVFGAGAPARKFLMSKHPMLDNKAPIDVAIATQPGAEAVVNLIGRAAYGGGV